MIHLATVPTAQGLRLTWLADHPKEGAPTLSLDFSRLVLGACLDPGFFVCVVGERRVEGVREQARYYIVLDEAETPQAQPLIDQMIQLKDRYRCRNVFCPSQPVQLVESMRRTEGLSYYRQENLWKAASMWPSFVDFDVKAGLYTVDRPDESTLHREIELFLQSDARFPDSGAVVKDLKGATLRQLMLPNEFECSNTRAGIRQGSLPACIAVWMAVSGLEKSPGTGRNVPSRPEQVVDGVTGY